MPSIRIANALFVGRLGIDLEGKAAVTPRCWTRWPRRATRAPRRVGDSCPPIPPSCAGNWTGGVSVGAFVGGQSRGAHRRDRHQLRVARLLAAGDSPFLVLADDGKVEERTRNAGRVRSRFISNNGDSARGPIKSAGRPRQTVCAPCFIPLRRICGNTRRGRAFGVTDPDVIGLCFDTGITPTAATTRGKA